MAPAGGFALACEEGSETFDGAPVSATFFGGDLFIEAQEGTLDAYTLIARNTNGREVRATMDAPSNFGGLDQFGSITTDDCVYDVLVQVQFTTITTVFRRPAGQ